MLILDWERALVRMLALADAWNDEQVDGHPDIVLDAARRRVALYQAGADAVPRARRVRRPAKVMQPLPGAPGT